MGLFGLPRPDPLGFPESPEQAVSDFLLHAGITAGAVIGVYAYTGLYAGPGTAGTIYAAFFSTAEAGAAGASTVALSDTIYAMSVYAEPFVAVGGFIVRWSLPTFALYGFYKAATDPSPSMAPHRGGVRGSYRLPSGGIATS